MEQGLKDLRTKIRGKAKKFGMYSPAHYVSCENVIALIDRIEALEEELVEAERVIAMINNEPRLYDTIKSLASKYAKKHGVFSGGKF